MRKVLITTLLILHVVAIIAKEDDLKNRKNETIESSATMVLTGSIADEDSGESLVGVEVSIEGTDLKTYTDFDGAFSFKNIKPGDYKLSTNYISYQMITTAFKASQKQDELKIKLRAVN